MSVAPASTPTASSSALSSTRALRPDIQGLRAVAVLLVVVYHLWPDLLPGGFVGVDVFFVISGYLIIGMLHRELARTGRISLPEFYAKRIRRLLPAATATLVFVTVTTMTLLPLSLQPATLAEVVAAALNVQNWQLALFSTGYAHATASASPLQHFWSLGVEEQFYILIPLLMVLGAAIGQRRSGSVHPARAAVWLVVATTILSFLCSVVFSRTNHDQAYFVTPTRMWELGIGGLLAVAPPSVVRTPALRRSLGWAGLVLVLASARFLTTAMPFPGSVALLPTVGAVLLLSAGQHGQRLALSQVSTWRGWLGRELAR